MNNIIKNILILTGLFVSLFLLAFLINPLLGENISYSEQILEDFFQLVGLYPFYMIADSISNPIVDYSIGIFMIVLIFVGILIPIILILKKKKLFPYILFYFLCIAVYLFFGIVVFGIRNGEVAM